MSVPTSKPLAAARAAALMLPEDTLPAAPILERPDGFYWQSLEGRQQFGPYESYELAREARDADSEESLAPRETLHAVEDEIGIASWIDAETGAPPEGGSPPHLPEE